MCAAKLVFQRRAYVFRMTPVGFLIQSDPGPFVVNFSKRIGFRREQSIQVQLMAFRAVLIREDKIGVNPPQVLGVCYRHLVVTVVELLIVTGGKRDRFQVGEGKGKISVCGSGGTLQ